MIKSSYELHPMWTSLDHLDAHLQSFTEKSDERFEDLIKKAEYLRWMLNKSDPSLIQINDLADIQIHLTHINNHIPNNANNWAHYPHIEGFFAHIFKTIPYPRIKKLFKSDVNKFIENSDIRLSDAIIAAEEKISNVANKIDENLLSLNNEQNEFQEKLSESEARLANLNDENSELEKKVDAHFENWETKLDTEIKEKLGELVETFSDNQAKRRTEHQEMLDEIAAALRKTQSETDASLAANKKQMAVAENNLTKMSAQFKNDAESLLNDINKIYGIAGNNALSGDFAKTATSEAKAYNHLTILAALFYIAIPLSFAYLWLNYTDTNQLNFMNLLSRLPISLVFLAPALYFGNLAQKHRRVSIAFRSLGLRIATFDAYLASFNNEDKNEEKKKMSSIFFDAKISSERNDETNYKEVGKALDQISGPLEKVLKFTTGKTN